MSTVAENNRYLKELVRYIHLRLFFVNNLVELNAIES